MTFQFRKKLGMPGRVSHMAARRGKYRIVVWKPEEKRQLGTPWLRWEDNIKMDLQEVGWGRGLDRAGSG